MWVVDGETGPYAQGPAKNGPTIAPTLYIEKTTLVPGFGGLTRANRSKPEHVPSPRLVPSVKRSIYACIPLIPVLKKQGRGALGLAG